MFENIAQNKTSHVLVPSLPDTWCSLPVYMRGHGRLCTVGTWSHVRPLVLLLLIPGGLLPHEVTVPGACTPCLHSHNTVLVQQAARSPRAPGAGPVESAATPGAGGDPNFGSVHDLTADRRDTL